MKSFFVFLQRNKLYSAINLIGLSLSMAFVLLLAVYVQRQLSTDSFQENADRIFAVASLVVLFVAMLAVLWQSLKTANTNPVEALKKE